MTVLAERGTGFKHPSVQINVTMLIGTLVFRFVANVEEYERELIRKRVFR